MKQTFSFSLKSSSLHWTLDRLFNLLVVNLTRITFQRYDNSMYCFALDCTEGKLNKCAVQKNSGFGCFKSSPDYCCIQGKTGNIKTNLN